MTIKEEYPSFAKNTESYNVRRKSLSPALHRNSLLFVLYHSPPDKAAGVCFGHDNLARRGER